VSELEELQAVVAEMKAGLDGAVLGVDTSHGDMTVLVDDSKVHEALAFLKANGFNQLLDIGCVDCLHLKRERRFEIVYILYSIPRNLRMRLKITLPGDAPVVQSATDLWRAADWAEREAFDMFGVRFEGHPNLKRILCHHEFEGHALRKDYPIMKGQWCSGTRDLREDIEKD